MSRAAPVVILAAAAVPAAVAPVPPPRPADAGHWPMLGGTPARNMVNLADRLPALPDRGPDWNKPDDVAAWSAEWVRWKADLGSRSYGGPVVAGGRVYVGTNNERPRNKRDVDKNGDPIDKGVLMCFREADGRFLWQAVFDKLESGHDNDWPHEGLVSTPTVEGNRVYFVTNRCTVVCADVNGFADGNQGITTEKYQTPTDCDILWEYDMIGELGVFPHNMASGCPLIVGDLLFTTTSNGVDQGHINIPAPDAPSLIALDKRTGRLVWKDASPGKDIMHGQWSSPAYAPAPVPQVIAAQGDGWVRAFDPPTGKLLWKFDANPKDGVYELGGHGTKSEFVAAPAVVGGRLYIGVGQDPEHTDGIGRYWCIDLRRAVAGGRRDPDRDVSPELVVRAEPQPGGRPKVETRPNPESAAVWMYGGEDKREFAQRDWTFGRTMCTACVVDDLLYVGDMPGFVHCLDARTGRRYWMYDTKSSIWPACYYADGKVFAANETGDLYVWRHDPRPDVIPEWDDRVPTWNAARKSRLALRREVERKYLLAKIEFDAPFRTSPVVAGGVLHVMTERSLFAVGKPDR
jgi:outer membrane protein assembly factor BamB